MRECISCFNLEALEILDLPIPYIVQSLIKGLKERPLQLSLSKKTPQDMTELLSRFEKYINSEGTLKFVIGIEVPMNEREPYRAMKRKDE